MLHLASMITPSRTMCQIDIRQTFADHSQAQFTVTSDGDFFVQFGKKFQQDVCRGCAENGLYEEDADSIFPVQEDAYLDAHMESFIGGDF